MGSTEEEHVILTRAKLAHIVKVSQGAESVELLEASLKSLSSMGKNYSGDIVFADLKARVDGSSQNFSWAIKLPPLGSKDRMPIHREFMVERKEIAFYTEILPAWKKLIEEREAGFAITCYDAPYTEFNDDMEKGSLVVMQNLQPRGFEDARDKKHGLDMHHARLALAELAKFHALGYAHLKSYSGGVEEGLKCNELFVTDYLFINPSPTGKAVMQSVNSSMITSMQNLLSSVQEPGQDFVGAFMKAHEKEDVFTFRTKLYRPDTDGFKTVCHGDTHLNNLLFKQASNVCMYFLIERIEKIILCPGMMRRHPWLPPGWTLQSPDMATPAGTWSTSSTAPPLLNSEGLTSLTCWDTITTLWSSAWQD